MFTDLNISYFTPVLSCCKQWNQYLTCPECHNVIWNVILRSPVSNSKLGSPLSSLQAGGGWSPRLTRAGPATHHQLFLSSMFQLTGDQLPLTSSGRSCHNLTNFPIFSDILRQGRGVSGMWLLQDDKARWSANRRYHYLASSISGHYQVLDLSGRLINDPIITELTLLAFDTVNCVPSWPPAHFAEFKHAFLCLMATTCQEQI